MKALISAYYSDLYCY